MCPVVLALVHRGRGGRRLAAVRGGPPASNSHKLQHRRLCYISAQTLGYVSWCRKKDAEQAMLRSSDPRSLSRLLLVEDVTSLWKREAPMHYECAIFSPDEHWELCAMCWTERLRPAAGLRKVCHKAAAAKAPRATKSSKLFLLRPQRSCQRI